MTDAARLKCIPQIEEFYQCTRKYTWTTGYYCKPFLKAAEACTSQFTTDQIRQKLVEQEMEKKRLFLVKNHAWPPHDRI
ncbi:hypothetical protein BC833DRAFT_621307 [Globomyces pollinis-pini]|nr:hypothetical protein BC833DRAFT_621307 [Globomyces pollinis-pini]